MNGLPDHITAMMGNTQPRKEQIIQSKKTMNGRRPTRDAVVGKKIRSTYTSIKSTAQHAAEKAEHTRTHLEAVHRSVVRVQKHLSQGAYL